MKNIFVIFFLLLLTSCALGPANYKDSPNGLQRAEIISKNIKGITVERVSLNKRY